MNEKLAAYLNGCFELVLQVGGHLLLSLFACAFIAILGSSLICRLQAATMGGPKLSVLALLVWYVAVAQVDAGKTYYVSNDGKDSASGSSPQEAWATVLRVNQETFSPGDAILFRAGDTFSPANLTFKWPSSGTPDQPIVIR